MEIFPKFYFVEIFLQFKPKRLNKNGMVSEWNDDKLRGMWYHDSLELLYMQIGEKNEINRF